MKYDNANMTQAAHMWFKDQKLLSKLYKNNSKRKLAEHQQQFPFKTSLFAFACYKLFYSTQVTSGLDTASIAMDLLPMEVRRGYIVAGRWLSWTVWVGLTDKHMGAAIILAGIRRDLAGPHKYSHSLTGLRPRAALVGRGQGPSSTL